MPLLKITLLWSLTCYMCTQLLAVRLENSLLQELLSEELAEETDAQQKKISENASQQLAVGGVVFTGSQEEFLAKKEKYLEDKVLLQQAIVKRDEAKTELDNLPRASKERRSAMLEFKKATGQMERLLLLTREMRQFDPEESHFKAWGDDDVEVFQAIVPSDEPRYAETKEHTLEKKWAFIPEGTPLGNCALKGMLSLEGLFKYSYDTATCKMEGKLKFPEIFVQFESSSLNETSYKNICPLVGKNHFKVFPELLPKVSLSVNDIKIEECVEVVPWLVKFCMKIKFQTQKKCDFSLWDLYVEAKVEMNYVGQKKTGWAKLMSGLGPI